MTITQIKYFITAAKCLNFTKAADKLFITQPALSRQIASIEMELNMQLFIRNNRSVKLTPAAVVLLDEFEKIYNDYNLAVAKAQSSFAGLSGELNIGILEGAYVGDLFPGVLQHFAQYYPQVKINLRNYSFNMLIDWFGAECDTDMYRLWHPGAHLHSEWAEFEPYHKKGNVIGSTHLSKEIVGGQPTEATLKYLDAHEIYGEKLDEAKVRGDVDVILYACCALGDWDKCIRDEQGRPLAGQYVGVGRDTPYGLVLRNHYWLGDTLPFPAEQVEKMFPIEMGLDVMNHGMNEFHILSKVIPTYYLRDKWEELGAPEPFAKTKKWADKMTPRVLA